MFTIFFVVLYAILTYGLMFAAQQSLNLGAQEGARGMLRVTQADSMARRVTASKAMTQRQVGWVGAIRATPVSVEVCGAPGMTAVDCVNPTLAAGQIQVRTAYQYGRSPLVPQLPLLGRFILPADLVLRSDAVVQLGDLSTMGGAL